MLKLNELKKSNSNNIVDVIKVDKMEKVKYSYRIVITGESGVGKTSIINRSQSDSFEEKHNVTACFEHYWNNYKVNDALIRIQFWDTCGQELYHGLIKNFYRSCTLGIIVFALNDINSFIKVNEWLNEIREICGDDRKVILVGNKKDLKDQRVVSMQVIEKFLIDNMIDYYIETSALNGENVEELFKETVRILYNEYVVNKTFNSEKTTECLETVDLNNPYKKDTKCKECLCCGN